MIPDPSRTEREIKKMRLIEMERTNYVGFLWMQRFFHPRLWYLVNASADIHDDNYKEGGDEYDRLRADQGFVERMFDDASKVELLRMRGEIYWNACWYYIAVRTLGWLGFRHKNRLLSIMEILGTPLINFVVFTLKAYFIVWLFSIIF